MFQSITLCYYNVYYNKMIKKTNEINYKDLKKITIDKS